MEGSKRTRSRKGCQTCRRRKVRCDERHPACGACLRLRLRCEFVDPDDAASSRKPPQTRQARYRVRFASAQTGRAGNSSLPVSPTTHADRTQSRNRIPVDALSPLTPPDTSPDGNAQASPHASGTDPAGVGSSPSPTASRRFEAGPRGAQYLAQSQPWMAGTSYQPGQASTSMDSLNTSGMDSMLLDAMGFQADMPQVARFEGSVDASWDVLPAFDDLLSTGFGYPNSTVNSRGHQGAPSTPADTFYQDIVRAEPPRQETTASAPRPATSPPSLLALASTTTSYIQRPLQPSPPISAPPPPPPPTAAPSVASSLPHSSTGSMVIMRPEDREPLQHFLTTMVQFVKLRSSNSDNIYCYIFTNMALTHAPLYEAILAWAALHKAHIKSTATADAELRYQRASRLLYEDTQGAASHIDLTIVTIWFLLQYELFLAKGVTRFVALLDYAASVIRPLFETSNPAVIHERLGPVALRVVIWLSAYDARAAPFGGNCHLLQCLKTYLSDQEGLSSANTTPTDTDADGAAHKSAMPNETGPSQSASDDDENSLNGIFGGITSEPTSEMQACLRLALRLNIARGSCSLLGRCGWWNANTDFDREKHAIAWEAVRNSMISIKKRLESSDAAPAVKMALRVAGGDVDISPADLGGALQFNWMQLVAIYYGCVLIYQTNRPSSVTSRGRRGSKSDPTFSTAADSAASIIRLSRHATLARPNSPHCIWSQLLFQAGVEIKDPIYQSWAVDALSRAEAWSPNLRKTRHLLERVIKLRRDVKGPCDVPAVMEAAGEVFVL